MLIKWINQFLLLKILGAFIGIIILIFLLSSWRLQKVLNKQIINQTTEKSWLILESLESSVSTLLDHNQPENLTNMLKSLSSPPFINSIVVCDNQGNTIKTGFSTNKSNKCPDTFVTAIIDNNKSRYHMISPDNKYLYTALSVSQNQYSHSKKDTAQSFILLTANIEHEKLIYKDFLYFMFIQNIVILLAASLLIMLVLHITVLKPLKSYKYAIRRIGKKLFDFKLPDTSNDELGTIAKAINRMSDEIQAANDDVKDNNHILKEYKNAIDSSAIVIKSNFSGKITYVNEVFKEITGFSNEEIIGLSINVLRGEELSDENILEYWDSLLNCVVWKEVLHNKAKDGKDYYVNVTVSPIQDSEGEIVEYIDIWHNVTEIFELKEELLHHKENLEELVTHRTTELINTNNQLSDSESKLRKLYEKSEETNQQLKQAQTTIIQQEKLASIGHLAAGIAHELNNPIGFVSSNFNTMKAYIQKLQNYTIYIQETLTNLLTNTKCQDLNNQCIDKEFVTSEINQKKQKLKIDFILEDLQAIFKESDEGFERVTSIVNNLRSFSRVDFDEKMQLHDINEGIRNTLIVAKNEIKYVADIITDLEDIPKIEGYGGEINQVFLNVIVNATQAIEDQKREDKGKISIVTKQKADQIICTIHDDGPGISEKNISQVFDPFFTTKEPGKGTGLGLNISYDIIVNKHHGQMTVQSYGTGTTFTIILPIRQDQGEIT